MPTRNPITGVPTGGIGRNRDSEPSSRAVNGATARCYQHGSAGLWQVVTLTVGSKRRRLLMAGDDDEMFMTRSYNVTPKRTEQHLIARSDKYVAYVTNNKRLHSTCCTVEANY